MKQSTSKMSGIVLQRDVPAILIPDGFPVLLKRGEQVDITQVLGGKFTVQATQGQLFRVEGHDADALGQEVPPMSRATQSASQGPLSEQVWHQLKQCYDPEIPVNVVELGLIYGCDLAKQPDGTQHVHVRMTLTAPGCGMGEVLRQDIEQELSALPGVSGVSVELVFDPPWDKSRMSEAARLQLGLV
ncbi:MAG: putative Fe-S cluster assembly protein SufT [Myxococcota bacterium]